MKTLRTKIPVLFALAFASMAFYSHAHAQDIFRVTTQEIVAFQQLQGQPQWQQSMLNRIAGAQWVFSSDDQTFLFNAPNVRTDLFPIRGKFQVNNGEIFFQGESQSQTGYTGIAMARIQGRIYQQGTQTYLSMSYVTTFGTAAVIYNQNFSSGSTSAYNFTVSLRDL